MIIATVYPRRTKKPSWGLRLQGGNGEKIGHSYNDPDDAEHAAELLFGDEQVELRIEYSDGTVIGRRTLR